MQLIEQLKHSINSSVDIALRLYEQGKRDGLTNKRIREDIEIALSGIVKERQLRNILPLELKRHYTFDPNDSAMIWLIGQRRELFACVVTCLTYYFCPGTDRLICPAYCMSNTFWYMLWYNNIDNLNA